MLKLLDNTHALPIPNGSQIYFLLHNGTIVYVGKSNGLLARIGQHQKDKEFDSVKHFPVPEDDQSVLETALIKSLKPKYNGKTIAYLTDAEKEVLHKYSFEDALIRSMVRTQPQVSQCEWGPVAFFHDDELIFGLYDDDCAIDELEDHDDDCKYLQAMQTLELEEDDEAHHDLIDELCEFCACQERAIVLTDFHHYYVKKVQDLYDVSNEYFKKYHDDFSEKYFKAVKELREKRGLQDDDTEETNHL